jgi:serine/threonine protein kinase
VRNLPFRTFAAPIDLVEGVNSIILLTINNSDSLSQNISMTTVYCTKGHENQDSNHFCQICGEKLNPPVPQNTLIAGKVLEDRYRIVQQIGQGGFGRAYLCENLTRFNEPCVLKEFAPQVQGTYALEKAKKLFEREASVLHNLAHPQIPRFRELFELKTGSQGLFLVQDYVAGQTYRYLLAARQNQNRLFTEDEIRQLLNDTLPVLQYIHSLGVIHRDIAPDNLILRSSDNLPVLIDFGGVKQIAVNAEIQATGNTEVPTCLGKVGYAPHEQMQRGTVSANSDLYALAATCLVLLTGKEPTELIDPQSLTWNWRSIINLESNLGPLFDKMLQPNPVARFQSASEVLGALKKQVLTPKMPVTQLPVQPANSQLGTVVVSPGVASQKQPNLSQPSAPGNDSSFLKILSQSWMALLGVGAVGAIAWAGHSIFNKPNTTTPTTPAPAAISNPSSASTPSSTPVTENTPSPEATGSSRNASNINTGTDGSNTSKITIDKPSSDKPNNGGLAGDTNERERRRSSGIAKPPKEAAASGESSRREQPRRNATNIITPPIRRNSTADDEPVLRPSKPASQTPVVEEFETKPRPPKTPSESKPVNKPRVEELDIKPAPRPPKTASEEKPVSRPPKVEEFDTEPQPRRQSATKPDNPDKPAKKPVKKSEGGDDDPLF